jgi:hypothetical protein
MGTILLPGKVLSLDVDTEISPPVERSAECVLTLICLKSLRRVCDFLSKACHRRQCQAKPVTCGRRKQTL